MTKDIREALQETPNRGPTTFPRTAPAHTRWLQDIRGEVDLKHPTTLWSTLASSQEKLLCSVHALAPYSDQFDTVRGDPHACSCELVSAAGAC